jgi:hypothetical protein
MAVGIRHVGQHLAPQRALADRAQALFERIEVRLARHARELGAERPEVAEREFVDDTDDAIEF